MAMLLPPVAEYVNADEHALHLWQIRRSESLVVKLLGTRKRRSGASVPVIEGQPRARRFRPVSRGCNAVQRPC
jgi:hypothetical protein